MNTQLDPQDRDILRWGGAAGMAGSAILILVFVLVFTLIGADPTELAGWVERFPGIRGARTVENSLYLLVLLLWAVDHLALYRALRTQSPAPALFGTFLAIVSLTVLAAGALPHVATIPLSDLYFADAATPADRAALILIWQATDGIFDALLVTGLGILPLGVLLLGGGMLRGAAFGAGYAWATLALGAVGLAAAVVLLIDPASPIAIAAVLAPTIFHFVVGLKIARVPGSNGRRGDA